VAANRFHGRKDKYDLDVLTLGGVLRQLCFDDNLVQFTEGVPMSVFFFQVTLPDDDRVYFVRVRTKFSERNQARAKARAIAANRFSRIDFTTRPISEDDLFGVIASGDSTGIEIITAGCEVPGTSQQVKMMANTIEAHEKTIAEQKSEIEILKSDLADANDYYRRQESSNVINPNTDL